MSQSERQSPIWIKITSICKQSIRWALFIFFLSLILRLVHLFQVKSADPIFYYPIMDGLYHHNWAIRIIKEGWFGNDSFFRAPLYPYFIALLYKIFGIHLLIPRIAQSLIGSFNCVLTSMIGGILFNKKIGIISGIIASVYPLFIYFDNELLIPTFLIFLILLGFYFILKESSNDVSKLGCFFTGIIWGLAAITRPNVLLFLVILCFWVVKKSKKFYKTIILYGLLGVITIIIPITIRNYIVSREFVLIAWQGGTNFYIGNNPDSDGFTAIVPGTRKTWWGGFYDAKQIAETAMKKELENSEIDRYWFKKGLEFVKKEPLKTFYLSIKKVYLFFGGLEIGNNRDIYFFSHLTYLKFLIFNLPLLQFPFGIIFPLFLLGVFFFIKHSKMGLYCYDRKINILLVLLFVISYFLSFIIFFVCARFRLVIIPFLIIFASYAILSFIDNMKRRTPKVLVIPLLFFILIFLFFNANIFSVKTGNPVVNYLTLGVAYKKMGRVKETLDCYTMAIQSDPNQPEGYYNIGNIYAENGDYNKAKEMYRKAIEVDPLSMRAYNNLGIIYIKEGNYDEAKKMYCKAIEIDPNSARGYNNLGNIYFEIGEYDKALECYKQASILEPDYEKPLYHAGLVHMKLGNAAKAESLWQKVLTINPNNKQAKATLKYIQQSRGE